MENIRNLLDNIENLSIVEVFKLESVFKNKMHFILEHYIQCNRGYHYNLIFDKVIKPHFDSIEILEDVLKSSIVKNTSNVIIGSSGAKIYPELLKRLLLVDSEKVKSYLLNEFKKGS